MRRGRRSRCRGLPDAIKGLVPAAFVTLKAGPDASSELEQAIRDQIVRAIGKIAVPDPVFFTDALPKTPSGKIMRRLLKEILATGDIGSDLTALEDRSTIAALKALVNRSRPA